MEIVGAIPGVRAAVAAWLSLPGASARPTRVWRLDAGHKGRTIYRLEGIDADGSAVIAKLCRPATGGVERWIYETVLPDVPVTTPRYFGSVEAEAGLWLFLEDVGLERFSTVDAAQRTAAARWLGELHTRAVDIPAAARLPDKGPDYHLERLRVARDTISENLDRAAVRADDAVVLRSVVGLLDRIESEWASIEAFCARMPSTLTHGDVRRKNVYVRRDTRTNVVLYPIDWEMAGWGIPAPDLAPARGPVEQSAIDLAGYAETVRWRWPKLGEVTCRRLAVLGTVFRRLAAIDWAAQGLVLAWPQKPIAQLRVYLPELEDAFAVAPWRDVVAAAWDG